MPMLKKIHGRLCGEYVPWWRKEEGAAEAGRADEEVDAEAYRGGAWRKYVEEGEGETAGGGAERCEGG